MRQREAISPWQLLRTGYENLHHRFRIIIRCAKVECSDTLLLV